MHLLQAGPQFAEDLRRRAHCASCLQAQVLAATERLVTGGAETVGPLTGSISACLVPALAVRIRQTIQFLTETIHMSPCAHPYSYVHPFQDSCPCLIPRLWQWKGGVAL